MNIFNIKNIQIGLICLVGSLSTFSVSSEMDQDGQGYSWRGVNRNRPTFDDRSYGYSMTDESDNNEDRGTDSCSYCSYDNDTMYEE